MPDTYLAVFLGNKNSPRMQAWMALSDAERCEFACNNDPLRGVFASKSDPL